MTNRADIKKGFLIYTCNCGFIDTGHAKPGNYTRLWKNLRSEENFPGWPLLSRRQHTIDGQPAFGVYWGLRMKLLPFTGLINAGDLQPYLIRKGLGICERRSIMLRIAMDESVRFELMQATWPYSILTRGSGFSAEDLTSNLLGMYQVMGISWPEVLRICKETDIQTALDMYDKHFPDGISEHKVTHFYQPLLFPCKACPQPQTFPYQFSIIRPADTGTGEFIRVDRRVAPINILTRYNINFSRDGRPKNYSV